MKVWCTQIFLLFTCTSTTYISCTDLNLQGDSAKDERRHRYRRRETDHRSYREQQKSETSKTEGAALTKRPTNFVLEENGTHIHGKNRIVKKCVEFYEELYRSRRPSADQDTHDDRTTTSTFDPPSILLLEVEASIKRLKRNKAPEENNITDGILQDRGDVMIQILTDLFNTCLHHQQVPKAWKNALIVLIHKKWNTSDITKLQTNQFDSRYVQGVFKNSSTKDDSYTGLPPITWASQI